MRGIAFGVFRTLANCSALSFVDVLNHLRKSLYRDGRVEAGLLFVELVRLLLDRNLLVELLASEVLEDLPS